MNNDFELIKHIDKNKIEYWTARELATALGYTDWRNFTEVIKKSQTACLKSLQNIDDHFVETNKMIKLAKNAIREIIDYKLSRYACYLVAQNGDSGKKEIASAQTYFAVQTRKQEIFQSLSDDDKRIFMRNEVTHHNKKLFSTAKNVGVSNFGIFNNEGYKGLYGMPLSEIEKRKGIKKGELLDHAGSTELAANLFRITQTDDKIVKEKIKGQKGAGKVHNEVGKRVRRTILDIGGEMPENLPIEKKLILNKNNKKLLK